jgi:hypothetical protein
VSLLGCGEARTQSGDHQILLGQGPAQSAGIAPNFRELASQLLVAGAPVGEGPAKRLLHGGQVLPQGVAFVLQFRDPSAVGRPVAPYVPLQELQRAQVITGHGVAELGEVTGEGRQELAGHDALAGEVPGQRAGVDVQGGGHVALEHALGPAGGECFYESVRICGDRLL